MTEETVAKFSIVMKFWKDPTEVEATDFVVSYNKITKKTYIDFFDKDGRLWQVPEDDCIIIRNYPDDSDKEYFERIERETKEGLKIKKKEIDMRDVV